MNKKKPFNKETTTKIPFSELVELIGTQCDYKFAIIDYEVDEELKSIAIKAGIDLEGYKHVIETTGVNHSQNRHGEKSNDRSPLSIEDYLLIPYIIKHRDKVEISNNTSRSHHSKTFIYRKTVVTTMFMLKRLELEGIKAWRSKRYTKGQRKKPHNRGFNLLSREVS